MTNNSTTVYKIRIAAIITVAVGYGWAGGHYIPNNSTLTAYVFQAVIFLTLLIFSVAFAGNQNPGMETTSKNSWPTRGLSIFTFLTLIINIANIIHGALAKEPGSFGSHNTVADLVPVSIIMAGDILWLITLPGAKKNLKI
jgi:hypothetical protein